MIKSRFIILFFLISQLVLAQDYDDEDYEDYETLDGVEVKDVTDKFSVEPETEEYSYEQRYFDPNLSDKYKGKDFDYSEDPPEPVQTQNQAKPKSSNDGRLFRWLAGISASFGKILLYIIIALAVLVVLYVLVQSIYGINFLSPKLKKKKIKNSVQTLEENHDDIADNNYIGLAKRAESEGNYRMAFRYLFLDLLQNLNLKSYIDWRKNKTNNDYTYEIKNADIQREYKDLARNFDYVWYGNSAIDNIKYDLLKKEFEIINKQLK